MAAADLALCRAGASVLGEMPAVGLPAVLVPYPYAGGHQRHNATYLAENGAATVMANGELERQLLPVVGELLHAQERLRAMSEAARRLARPDAARNIARLLMEAAQA
jgi:UDP-N-acetylglucosamine--N-acetylmuramyl-(pentapeptide) pyrophosphoryl-undecaprenol N-acetylglucosamine transferase